MLEETEIQGFSCSVVEAMKFINFEDFNKNVCTSDRCDRVCKFDSKRGTKIIIFFVLFFAQYRMCR